MVAVRVTRLLITCFRGWRTLDLRPESHVLLAGVPRSGRSDIVAALSRVLDPEASRSPAQTDLWQGPLPVPTPRGTPSPGPAVEPGQAASTGVQRADTAEIEVTLAGLDPDVQQLFDGFLEPMAADGQAIQDGEADSASPLCVRLTYRLTYDAEADALDNLIYYPTRSNPATGQFARVPAATRRALPVITLSASRPLQLRGGGNLRKLIDEREPEAAALAFETLRKGVDASASALSAHPAISATVEAVLSTGGTNTRLGDTPVTSAQVGFHAEDGSLSALLRTVQPSLDLDTAGPLPLISHGSTATAVLSAAEALLLATVPGAVVLADDFGDQLDAAAAEHLAAVLRAGSGQLWLSTRRPEAARAFEPAELVRLVRHGGVRAHHQLPKTVDRKKLPAMRQLHTQLLAALTAPTVAIVEGPHDVTVYSAVDRKAAPARLPLSAAGVRLVAAGTGEDGGITKIPMIAELARQLGFRVIALIDQDKGGAAVEAKVQAACDVVIRLPPKHAIERAMLAGIPASKIRAASATLVEYGIPDPVVGRGDEAMLTELCKVLHKQGLHEQMLSGLDAETGSPPPMILLALAWIASTASPGYTGPAVVDVPPVAPAEAP